MSTKSTESTTPARPSFEVTLVNITDGSVQGHKAGCADLTRGNLRKHAEEPWTLEVTDKAQAWFEYNADFLLATTRSTGPTSRRQRPPA
jgi:hypothetical protein